MIVIFSIGVLVVVLGMLAGYFLGPNHTDKSTNMPYESGILSTGSAKTRFHVQFYLVALFFVVFDLESIFIYSWSVCVRELGVRGLIQISIFIGVLLLTLLYLLRTGALDIGPKLRKPGESR